MPEFERVQGPCNVDSDCDDGLVCNGIETCGTVSHQCVQGEPVECVEDDIECTIVRCEEPSGTCAVLALDAMCSSGSECEPSRGCVLMCTEPPPGECEPTTRCGCSRQEECFIDSTLVTACAAPGAVPEWQACDPEQVGGGCASGSQCVVLSRPGAPTVAHCRSNCRRDGDCGDPNECAIELGSGISVCTDFCDPYANTGCGASLDCDVVVSATDELQYYTDCRVGGPVPRLGNCSTAASCEAGLVCVSGGTNGNECLGICRINADCRPNEICGRFERRAYIGNIEIRPCLPQ